MRDISSRLSAAEALRISEERLRVALASSPAVVWNQDLELRYTWIHNPRQPFAASRVLGRTDSELLPREEAESLTRLKRRVLETGRGVRTDVRTTTALGPQYYDLTVEPLFDVAGRVAGITCAAWDVTDRQQMEDQQRPNPEPPPDPPKGPVIFYFSFAAVLAIAIMCFTYLTKLSP